MNNFAIQKLKCYMWGHCGSEDKIGIALRGIAITQLSGILQETYGAQSTYRFSTLLMGPCRTQVHFVHTVSSWWWTFCSYITKQNIKHCPSCSEELHCQQRLNNSFFFKEWPLCGYVFLHHKNDLHNEHFHCGKMFYFNYNQANILRKCQAISGQAALFG